MIWLYSELDSCSQRVNDHTRDKTVSFENDSFLLFFIEIIYIQVLVPCDFHLFPLELAPPQLLPLLTVPGVMFFSTV